MRGFGKKKAVMAAEDDFELLGRWRAGDANAGNALVRRHFSRVYRFFRSKVDEGVDDLTQQTFLAVVEGKDRIREGSSFKAYAFGVARRQLMMSLRRRYRGTQRLNWTEMSVSEVAEEGPATPSQIVAQRYEQRLLLAALRQIPVDYQIALELHYWEDMSVREIASVVDASAGTIKSRLSRGRTLLQRRIDRLAGQRGLVRLAGGEVGDLVSTLGLALEAPDPDSDPETF